MAGVRLACCFASHGSTWRRARPGRSKRKPLPDNPNDRGVEDRSCIAMDQEYEVRYWTEKFDVDRQRLQQAVNSVGNSAGAVENYLAGR